jgi:hypothetical protein
MKKLLVLLTLMVAVLCFTAGAFAQVGSPVCTSCKGAIRNVACPQAAAQATAACNAFDYDQNTNTDGYCSYVTANNHRAIFAICNCLNAAKFISGQAVAVKMTILVNGNPGANGVYWSAAAPAAIDFDTAATAPLACAIAAHAGVTATSDTFGAPSYFLSDGTTGFAALIANPTCAVPAASQATILTTPASAAIVLSTYGPYWWIDVPPMRLDPAVVKKCDKISVLIQLYDPTAPIPICPACVTTLCDCTIDVANVCCDCGALPPPVGTTLSFPYFTSLTAGAWWNGIVITNPSAASGSCTLTAKEQDGSTGTATVNIAANSLFTDLLSGPGLVWTGTGLGGSPCYITVVCNYNGAAGFAMMGQTETPFESMGYKVP